MTDRPSDGPVEPVVAADTPPAIDDKQAAVTGDGNADGTGGSDGTGGLGSSSRFAEPVRAAGHWFNEIASFVGEAYLRYSFTKGTTQEVGALIDLLDLRPGQRVLDVGCGPGRHALGLAAAGMDVTGVDISPEFVELATDAAGALGAPIAPTFRVADARTIDERDFDAVISLCQGAFGLSGGPDMVQGPDRELDEAILASMSSALVPGGRLAVSAFSAYFQLRYLEEQDTFDASAGVNHETTSIRDGEGNERPSELWTTCFTPRELRLLARVVGLEPVAVHGVNTGAYGPTPATIDCPEFLLLARAPDDQV